MSSPATIAEGKVVKISYTLKNSKGEIIDQADTSDPFPYLHGASQIVPGLENALVGLKSGDKKEVIVSPEEGYGQKDPGLRLELTRSQFPAGAAIEVGMQFEATNNQGDTHIFAVEAIEGDSITVDGNHPMAGQTLHFDIEVLDVRDASKEEMEHGHAHGPDGHHHH